jgi:hypothetical protein
MPQAPSFIPRRSFSPPEKPRASSVGLFNVIGGGIIVLAVLFSALAYGLRLLQEHQIETLHDRLLKITEELDPATVNAMDTLDKKIALVSLLLDEHAHPSQLFTLLEQKTLPEARYNSFAFSNADRTATLSIETKNYAALIKQLHVLRNEPLVESIEIAGVALGTGGTIQTTLTLMFASTLFQL